MTILRDYLRGIRPTKRPVYLLHSAPGECALVNWAQFGHIAIGRACRPLTAFVMVLNYSRQIFLRFFLSARMENFLRGHIQAFESWCGVPRVILYDNLRRPVLGPQGDDIRFHPILFEFAGHYRYEPRPVAIARGNERGGWSAQFDTFARASLRPASLLILMTSMLKLMFGAEPL